MIDKEILDQVLPVPDLDALKEEKIAQLLEEGFVITNFHSGGIFYTILMIVLRIKIEFTELLRTVLNNMFVTHASQAWLDIKIADYGKKRKAAQKTQGLVTLTRVVNDDAQGQAIKITKGHVFKTERDINGDELRFFALTSATMQQTAIAVDVLVEAEIEGTRYNVPQGQITRSLTYIDGIESITNNADWITREGSDIEDDSGAKARTLRSWSELAAFPIEDTYVNAAESVQGVLYAQADCQHPRGQGTVDVIVTGMAGGASAGLLANVSEAVERIAGPYDDILVKSSITVRQDIELVLTLGDGTESSAVTSRIQAILTDLLAVRRNRKLNELRLSDINHAIRSGYMSATNVQIVVPDVDIKLERDKVIILGSVAVTIKRE